MSEIVDTIKRFQNTFVYVDATQYIPYFPMDVNKLQIDGFGMSGQKIGGIKGSGLLYVKDSVLPMLQPIIFGEQGLVGGTYPTPMIISLATAFSNLSYDNEKMIEKRDYFVDRLIDIGGNLVGSLSNRLPNNIYIRFKDVQGLTLVNLLSQYGIYISTGSACSSESLEPSKVALAYGLSKTNALECVRLTINRDTTYEQIDYVVQIIDGLIKTLTM